MRWTPHATVACVIERQGKFLLVEELIDGRRVLNQPAGHLEPGETLCAAARRETLEETAWEVELTALLGMYTFTSPHNGVTYHRTCFIGSPLRHHRDSPLDKAILNTLWLSEAQLREAAPRLRSPMVLQAVEDYLAGRRYPLDVIREAGGDASAGGSR